MDSNVNTPDVLNFRDMGGIAAQDGRLVLPRRLYRSSRLSALDPAGAQAIAHAPCNIGTIIDLRTQLERTRRPDPEIEGVEQIACPLVPKRALGVVLEDGNLGELIRREWDPDTYDVCVTYRAMLAPAVAPQWKRLFHELLEAKDHGVLIHCTNGKDRTGVAAAIVLTALGASEEDVMRDYLASNETLASHRQELLDDLATSGVRPSIGQKVGPLLEARPEYLNAAFDAIDDNYGGFAGFMEDVCEFSIAEDERLHDLYLA